MKKIFILFVVAIALISVVLLNQETVVVTNADKLISKTPAPTPVVKESIRAILAADAPENKDLPVEIPSAHQFEREYLGHTESELAEALKVSELVLSQAGLVAKANHGQLNAQEKALLVHEMRRQGVLSHLLVELKLKRLKEKYL